MLIYFSIVWGLVFVVGVCCCFCFFCSVCVCVIFFDCMFCNLFDFEYFYFLFLLYFMGGIVFREIVVDVFVF